jgi:hypothetical protein
MKKWCLGALMSGVVLITMAACSGDKNGSQAPCKTGAEACFCYENNTCDDALSCFAGLCLDLQGVAGASFGQGGQPESSGGAADSPEGGMDGGGSAGKATTMGGSFTLGGSNGSAGKPNGGGGSSAGTGGTAPVELFPPDPAGCALVTSCPTCCETTGVYALDALANDATAQYVSAFSVTASSALAEFDFLGADQIGAIFFRFSTAQNIGSLSVQGSGTGGSLEIALVRAQGKDGCIYPVIAGSLSPTPDTCWGLGAGPYALLPADQIEIRVRALQGGRAALNVTGVQYGP